MCGGVAKGLGLRDGFGRGLGLGFGDQGSGFGALGVWSRDLSFVVWGCGSCNPF